MKFLPPLLLAGCAIPGIAPLELQQPKPEPFVVDIGNISLHCIYEGQILRYVQIEGEEPKKFLCVDPPQREGMKKS